MYFSPSTLGFYDPEISTTPADAVSITVERYAELMQGQAAGKMIVAAGGLPELADPPAESLQSWRARCEVTRRQALLSLYAMDNGQTLEAIKAAVQAAGGLTQIDWETASTFKRMNSTVLAIQQVMGWTDEQLDNLFLAAEQVPT